MENKEKQKMVKWLYQIALDHLEEVETYEDRITFQQTKINIMSFVGSVVPQRINEYD